MRDYSTKPKGQLDALLNDVQCGQASSVIGGASLGRIET
jgi:hypothetical protein